MRGWSGAAMRIPRSPSGSSHHHQLVGWGVKAMPGSQSSLSLSPVATTVPPPAR